jgi:deoxyribonuclease V
MHPRLDFDWSLSLDEAQQLQETLAQHVSLADDFGEIHTIAGIDIGYPRTPTGVVTGRAAVVVLRYPDLEIVEQRLEYRPLTFPRVPGLLSFREAPVALAALSQLRTQPDLLLVTGHGRAHPGRLGIACHLGVLLDLPSIGCAGEIAVGEAAEPGPVPGDQTPLRDADDVIGMALRTRAGSRPVYVSSGHRISLETATAIVRQCVRGFRFPEPTRQANRLAGQRP